MTWWRRRFAPWFEVSLDAGPLFFHLLDEGRDLVPGGGARRSGTTWRGAALARFVWRDVRLALSLNRDLVTGTGATTITVAINSSAFSSYTSGGVVHTRPQTGETVTAGYEFDFPVRFASALPVVQEWPNHRAVDGVVLQELLNP